MTGVTLFALSLFDRRRTHAAKVAAWIDESEEEHGRSWWLHVYNRGEHPIYDCALHTTGADPTPTPDGVWRDVVGPNEELNYFPLSEVTREEARTSGEEAARMKSMRFEFSFTDTEGRRWVRTRDGKLRRGRK